MPCRSCVLVDVRMGKRGLRTVGAESPLFQITERWTEGVRLAQGQPQVVRP